MGKFFALITLLFVYSLYPQLVMAAAAPDKSDKPDVHIASLKDLSVDSLRHRTYQTHFKLLKNVTAKEATSDTLMAGYASDGLQLYMRIDLPASAPPESGYPVVVLASGWIPREDTPTWDFGINPGSYTHETIHAFVSRGLAVVTAGYRGRGTVNGIAAQGIEFRDTWGNSSYLSPIFYSIDVLNLISGLDGLDQLDWPQFVTRPAPQFDTQRVLLLGHSQGGDVALNTLAVIGDNKRYPVTLAGASIWSGNIPDRFTQANTFGPMAATLEAFMSGDGSWTGSAKGKDGSLNPNFIFPWPADWIGTLDTASADWTWQEKQWSTPSVADALDSKYREMYATLNQYVTDLTEPKFQLNIDSSGVAQITHDPAVAKLMPQIGGYHHAKYLKIPLALHISDRDYYSIPAWNKDLADRINAQGGQAKVYIYKGNTHSLKTSKHRWFSPVGTVDGAPLAIERDTALLLDNQPL